MLIVAYRLLISPSQGVGPFYHYLYFFRPYGPAFIFGFVFDGSLLPVISLHVHCMTSSSLTVKCPISVLPFTWLLKSSFISSLVLPFSSILNALSMLGCSFLLDVVSRYFFIPYHCSPLWFSCVLYLSSIMLKFIFFVIRCAFLLGFVFIFSLCFITFRIHRLRGRLSVLLLYRACCRGDRV